MLIKKNKIALPVLSSREANNSARDCDRTYPSPYSLTDYLANFSNFYFRLFRLIRHN
ncbi:MAG: hypothetical protein AAF378_09430 [Cyanobacteria bacterium P01_A01_bin.84]